MGMTYFLFALIGFFLSLVNTQAVKMVAQEESVRTNK